MQFTQTFTNQVIKTIKSNNIPMLLGEPGIGKSSWLQDLASQINTACFTIPCNQLYDKADLTGARLIKQEKDGKETYVQAFFPHIIIQDAIDYAEKHPRETPLLFLDEINRTTADVTSAVLSMATEHKIGNTMLPENLKIVTTGNDKGNVMALDEASISRFVLYPVKPDTNTFLGLHDNLHPAIQNVLKKKPDILFCKKVNIQTEEDEDENDESIDDILSDFEEMSQFTTPRTVHGLNRWLLEQSDEDIQELMQEAGEEDGDSLLFDYIKAFVGKTQFAILLTEELTNNATTAPSQLTVIKPNGYGNLKSIATIGTRDDIANFASDLTDKEISNLIVYAVYEKEDNETIIDMLSNQINNLIPEDVKKLIQLINHGEVDKQNFETLMQTGTPLAKSLELLESML